MYKLRFIIVAFGILAAGAPLAWAQGQHIGYVYPAGGQQGTTFPIRFGGQRLGDPSAIVVTGEGVSVRLVDYYRVMNNQELRLLRRQRSELRKEEETQLSDAMVSTMAWFEFPQPIGPVEAPALDQEDGPEPSEQEVAKQNLLRAIENRFAEDERQPAVRSQAELVFAEVSIEPDAKPGRREIRVVTTRGISNPLVFYVGELPEVARRAMTTMRNPVLGSEHLAQRSRPAEEEEMEVTLPVTANGQIAAGELNRYRFHAEKGQRLVFQVKARELIPYVADGVPGWCQSVLRLHDADGNEVAYNDDFRSNPDPLIYYEVPEDGEYVLTINEALFRGRESFVYRINMGELPFVTSIFPLGGRAGESHEVEMLGWNLEDSTLVLPPDDANPGNHWIAATGGPVSNFVPFALGTLPEVLAQNPGDDESTAQEVSLPVVINGRMNEPGGWDVFEVEGKAGETIVAEVHARRLGSPMDSFVKVTDADGRIIALNDDHYDAASGLNTDHADSYLMVELPADGKYFVHIGDTRRQAGPEYAYRLRISHPKPDFELRVAPSRVVMRDEGSATLTVFAIRRDGFDGPISVNFKDLPEGFESGGATVAAEENIVKLSVRTTLDATENPVELTVVGTAEIGDGEIVREAVPAEDTMQAFLWRHLMPADNLPAVVYDRSYEPPEERVRPPIRDEDRPKDVERNLQRSAAQRELNNLERLYQEWLLTDEFANREIAAIEARLIQ